MTEQRAAAEALRSWLTGSSAVVSLATNGVHLNQAPAGTKAETGPYVVLTLATTRDDYAQENIRVDTELLWIVRGVVFGNSPVADDLDAAIDAALSNSDGGTLATEANGYRVWAVRERPLNTLATLNPGSAYSYAGGWYRVNVRRLVNTGP